MFLPCIFVAFALKFFTHQTWQFQHFRLSSCQYCPRGRLIRQLPFDFFDEKGLIMTPLKIGGSNWWTVITVLQSVINKKYFPEWHVYFNCWKIVSEKVCMTLTVTLPFWFWREIGFFWCRLSCLKSRFVVWIADRQRWRAQSDTNFAENVDFALLASSPWSFFFEFILEKVKLWSLLTNYVR